MPDLMACEGRYSSPPDWPGPITLGALGRVRYFGPSALLGNPGQRDRPSDQRTPLTRRNAYAAASSTLQGARVLWVKVAPPTHSLVHPRPNGLGRGRATQGISLSVLPSSRWWPERRRMLRRAGLAEVRRSGRPGGSHPTPPTSTVDPCWRRHPGFAACLVSVKALRPLRMSLATLRNWLRMNVVFMRA